jgi:opacity protein-like surface antigen
MKRNLLFLIVLITTTYRLQAQDSTLLNMLSDSMQANTKSMPVRGTFKGLYIVDMKTVESSARGALNFLIMHRFGKLNDGAYNFFGLDNATIRIGLDYGITDRLAVGIGRSSLDKTFDGYFKYRLLWQSDGSERMPLSLSVSGGLTHYTLKYPDKTYLNARYRTTYVTQLIAARKFNSKLSLQLVPVWLHYNLVPTVNDKNDVFAIGAGGRMKVTKRMSITAEYNYLLPNQVNSMDVHNALSLAWEIETGGHVFQLVFSNAQAMTEPQVISRTTGKWGDGDVYFGFNISRVFNISHKAKKNVAY